MPADENPTDIRHLLARISVASASWEFAGMPPVNPRDRASEPPSGWQGLAGLAADVDYYARRLWDAALAASAGETAGPPATLAALVRQSRPYIVLDQIDHYSTGSSSAYATVERDVAAYADAVVACLAFLIDTWAKDPRYRPALLASSWPLLIRESIRMSS